MTKSRLIIFPICWIFIIFISCTENKAYNHVLSSADSMMNLNDESAKIAIQMLDSMKPKWGELSKSQKMRCQLLYHKAMNKADIMFTSDSVMKDVVAYYDKYGSANERMLANYVLGCVYRDLHEAPLALEYYNKATEQADTTATDCDYGTLYRVYSQMGFIFSKQYLPYQILDAFSKAEKYAYLAKDTLNAIVNYQNKESAYYYLGNKDSVIAINLRAASMFKQYGNNYAAAIAIGCNYSYYIEKKDTLKAKEAFKAYCSTGYDGNSNYEDAKAYVLYQKGTYYLFTNLLDSAYYNLQQSLKLCLSYSTKAATTKVLAQYYAKTNQPTLSMKYALLSSEYNDSDLIEARKTQLQQMQAMYDYSRNQKQARDAEQKAERKNLIIYTLIIGSVLIFLSLTYFYLRQLKLKKKKIATSKKLFEDSLLKLKNMQNELDLLVTINDKKLAGIIKEKELTVCKLKEEIKDIKGKFSNSSLSETDILLQESSIYKRIKDVEQHPKEKMSKEDWKKLEETIEHHIPSFIPILKKRLNETDYRICLLVKLGISTSMMAILLELSTSAISVYRKRMLKKLCSKSGKPKDFDDFVRQIS